ncbi:Peroxidase 12 [Triticum urartu]|uniref:Peroxidase n=1 Tax=Triticum urartu TaxID=4572 RepID=M7ZIL0_TRIUA|nr:cationic peroxidase SPC4-like [Triticum urartu]EMS63038.1 Peroxidase 12 [Triticum urartu]
MASSRTAAMLVLVAAVLCPAALSKPSAAFISMPTDHVGGRIPPVSPADGLAFDFHADSCPQLQDVVRSAVETALQSEIALAAGLLRIFFHDCFPQGCDASVLLTGDGSELQLPPNLTLQPRALQLIESIRAQVHAACGPVVSCADITALATRDAVAFSGGQGYDVPLGRLDSLAPAPSSAVFDLPQASSNASTLIDVFETRNLDNVDLVALSGGHTIGKGHCSSFSNRFSEDSDFVRSLASNCSSDFNRLQDLDVTTPDVFDIKYFTNLQQGKGVFTSDQKLTADWRTEWVVNGFAGNHWWFFGQFAASMTKLGNLQGPQGNVGEIRRNSCFVRNGQSILTTTSDEGLAASA